MWKSRLILLAITCLSLSFSPIRAAIIPTSIYNLSSATSVPIPVNAETRSEITQTRRSVAGETDTGFAVYVTTSLQSSLSIEETVATTVWSTVYVTSAVPSESSIPTVWITETSMSEIAAVSQAEDSSSVPSSIPTVWTTVYSTGSFAEASKWDAEPSIPSTIWSTETSYLPKPSSASTWDAYPSITATITSSASTSFLSPSTSSTTTKSQASTTSSSKPMSTSTTSEDSLAGVEISATTTTTTIVPTPSNAPFGFLTYKYGQNVIMTDRTANNQVYKSKAKNNYVPDWFTVNLLTEQPTHSRRSFDIFKPNDKGDFGRDVDGSELVRLLVCEFTFHPGHSDNRPVFSVWDAEPYYFKWDPANKLDMNCIFDNRPDVTLTA
ncbi:hypothetical protein IAT40_000640 [Kwoniella sp. CBS 6097]